MSPSPFPWSEGESFVFDASGQAICREYSHNLNWKDDRALIAAIPEMVAALEEAKKFVDAQREQAVISFEITAIVGLQATIETVLQKVKT